jgi:hypothetical protein
MVLRAQDDLATLSLNIPTVAAAPGTNVCLDVTAENFDGIFGLSFTLLFDANALEYMNINNINLPSATLGDNFNTMNAGTGEIRMLWTSLSTQDYPSPFTLFTICFRVKGANGTIAPVRIADDPVDVEVIGSASDFFEDFVQGEFTNGAVWIRSGALPSLPEIDGAISIFSCDEQWKAGLDISVSGGAPPYQFNWSGPNDFQSAGEDLPILDFGVYFLTVTDQNQSPAYATFYIIQPDGIGAPGPFVESADITPAASCTDPDGAIVLNLNQDPASLSFSWSNGAATQNLSGVAPGEYGVTIVNANGCSSSWSGVVPKANDFEVTVDADPAICLREKGGITITSPLGANYQYNWAAIDGGTISGDGATIGSLSPGAYALTVTETTTGCAKTIQTSIPAMGNLPLTVETQRPGCDGAPGSAAVQLPSGQFSITWSTGEQTAQIAALPAGDYAVTVVDEDGGCVREEQISLQPLQLELVTQTQCKLSDAAPDSVFVSIAPSGGRAPYAFQWSNGTTTTAAGASTIGDRLPAALFATVTDQDGCIAYSEPNQPCGEQSDPAGFNASLYYDCTDEGEGIAFSAHVWSGGRPPYTFSWSNGMKETSDQTSTTPLPGAGFSAVTITDADGLTDVLVGHPLPEGACQELVENVQLTAPDLRVEIDEPFSLPIRLGEGIVPDVLEIEVHWDPDRLRLDTATAEYVTLNGSIDDLSQAGKARLLLPLSDRQNITDEVAIFQFTPTGMAGDVIPVVLGYNQWSATIGEQAYPISPRHGSVTLLPDGAKVWPGDTDQSRQVDHFDLLNIGLGYAATGPQRTNGSTEWAGQYLPDWGPATPESNVDYKHIDADGNGMIEAQDTMAISINWSRVTTHFRDPDEDRRPVPKINGAPLLVEGDQVSSAGPNSLPIVLGTAGQLAENVYGLAFSVHYQGPIAAESLWVDFTDSWLGEDGTPLLTIYRHFPMEKRVDVALVRTNGQGVSGFGTVARLVLRGNNQTNTPQAATVETNSPRAIDPAEKIVEVATGATQLTVDFNTLTHEPVWARGIRVFPVPASTELAVQTNGLDVESLQIVNIWGQVLAVFEPQNVLVIQDLAPGVYFLRIQTARGVAVRRWMKK